MYIIRNFKAFQEKLELPVSSVEEIFVALAAHNGKAEKDHLTLQFFFDEFCSLENAVCSLNNIQPTLLTANHVHDFWEMNYVTEGHCFEIVAGERLILQAGDLVIIPQGLRHSVYLPEDGKGINILFRSRFMQAVTARFESRMPGNVFTRLQKKRAFAYLSDNMRDAVFSEAFAALRAHKEEDNPVASLGGEYLASLFLLAVARREDFGVIISGDVQRQHQFGGDAEKRMIAYVRENYDTVDIRTLSQKFGYSPTQIYRIVKKQTGTNFSQMVLTLRLHRGEYLLANTAFSVGCIAEMVGFHSTEHFSRLFKNYGGVSPAAYRKTKRPVN